MKDDKSKKIVKMTDIIPPSAEQEKEEKKKSKFKLELGLEPEVIEKETPIEEVVAPAILEIEEERIFSEELFTPKTKKKRKKPFIIAGVVCFIIIGFIFYFTLSKAEIIIKPKTELMQFQVELNIDKGVAFIDLETNKVPAQLFQVEKEGEREFPATQEKELREKAKGTITIYNQYSSAPQTLVKTTRFVSEKGKLFRTTQTIIIPGAKVEGGQIIPSSINVEIEAAEPGKEYNIEPSSFTIPGFKGTAKYTGFYGKSTESMTGGIIGKVKVVSAEDIQGAKDILIVELKEKAKQELEKRIPTDLKILEDTSLEEVVESSSNVEADQPAEKFTVKVKVVANVLGFNENDAISLINDNLKEKISEDKIIMSDTININYTITDINLDKGTARLICEVTEDIAWKVDSEEIKQELAGKNEIEVRQLLSARPEIENAKIIFWPFWVKKIPSNEKKIKVTID